MFKQVILPLLAVMAFVVVVGIYLQRGTSLSPGPKPTPDNTTTIKVNGRDVKVEIADTDEERAKGLSGRGNLAENTGMLFVFSPPDASPIFWMKDTIIPLDIIWINDGKVVKIDANVQPPKEGTPDSQLTKYAASPVDYVLEVPAGYAAIHTLQVGDPVNL